VIRPNRVRARYLFIIIIVLYFLFCTAQEPSGKTGTVVGWGRVSEGGNLANIVQEVQVPILSLAQCRATKYRPQRITANMICAGRGIEDSCQVSGLATITSQKFDLRTVIYLYLFFPVSPSPTRSQTVNIRRVHRTVLFSFYFDWNSEYAVRPSTGPTNGVIAIFLLR